MNTIRAIDPVLHDVRSRISGLLFWIVLPVVAVAFIAAATITFADRVNAQPGGVKGTYTATLRSCQGGICTVGGTFTSEDKTLVVPNVLGGDYRLRVGEQRQVVLNPQTQVIALPARWNPTATLVGAFGGLVFLVLWTFCLVGSLGRRRASVRA